MHTVRLDRHYTLNKTELFSSSRTSVRTSTVRKTSNRFSYGFLCPVPYCRVKKINFIFNIWTPTARGSVHNPVPCSYLIAEPYPFGFSCSDLYPRTKENWLISQKIGPRMFVGSNQSGSGSRNGTYYDVNNYPFEIFRFFLSKTIFCFVLIDCAGSGFIFSKFLTVTIGSRQAVLLTTVFLFKSCDLRQDPSLVRILPNLGSAYNKTSQLLKLYFLTTLHYMYMVTEILPVTL